MFIAACGTSPKACEARPAESTVEYCWTMLNNCTAWYGSKLQDCDCTWQPGCLQSNRKTAKLVHEVLAASELEAGAVGAVDHDRARKWWQSNSRTWCRFCQRQMHNGKLWSCDVWRLETAMFDYHARKLLTIHASYWFNLDHADKSR